MEKQEIFETIVTHTREVLPSLSTRSIAPTDALRDLGANSIDRSEIAMMTLETLSLRVPLVELAVVRNIGELVDLLHAKLQQK